MSRAAAEELAEFLAGLRYDEIPDPVRDHARVCMLDTVGCGLFGSTLSWSGTLTDVVQELEPVGRARIWGTTIRTSPGGAALANGTAVHGFELDDLHPRSIVHPGSVVLPAAVAMAEHVGGVSGPRLRAAVIAGYEAAARVGLTVGSSHLLQGWHPTGTHGAVGAAAACGLILGLSPTQMTHALSLGATQASGLMSAQYGGMAKRMHAGRASQSGVYAAALASRGFTGVPNVFEAPYGGYCATFAPDFDVSALTRDLGTVWETLNVGFKPYSTNGSCHAALDALFELRSAHAFEAKSVKSVTADVSTATQRHVGWAYTPGGITRAQMNLPFILAVALTDGAAFVDQFTEARVAEPSVVELAQRISVRADTDIDAKGPDFRHEVHLRVVLDDGRTLHSSREHGRGNPKSPLSTDEVIGKFRILAGRSLNVTQVSLLESSLMYTDDVVPDLTVDEGTVIT